MDPVPTRRRRGVAATLLGLVAIAAMLLAACGPSARAASSKNAARTTASHTDARLTPAKVSLYLEMRRLWDQHMEWTYDTVTAFVSKSPGLSPTLNRLLQDQTDIGNAFKAYYGVKDGDELGDLLLTHIEDAVPVLTAAAKGDNAALTTAVDAWYANAKQVADFMSSLNPANWPQAQMESMWKTHITQTIGYSVDQLQGNYAKSISDYDTAQAHMQQMGDMLSQGIIAQFPAKFNSHEPATLTSSDLHLDLAMQSLWDQHMEWTYGAVTAFVSNSKSLKVGLDPTLTRILQNQTDIGNEFALYYGAADGNQLSKLLHEHIEDAVPVLTAAAKGDNAALTTAVDAWYANAKQVADFMSSLNPANWPQAQMESMWKTHITQTIDYAVDQLQGIYGQSILGYDLAEGHMQQMGDMLSQGIIAQYPAKLQG